jgi:branched-chain amino acid transport system ATP-binding protein
MLDEPSMGLAPIYVQRVFEMIKEINKKGVTILLVEQNAQAALTRAQRGYVLETGTVVMEDSTANLLKNERVKQCYLGIEEKFLI